METQTSQFQNNPITLSYQLPSLPPLKLKSFYFRNKESFALAGRKKKYGGKIKTEMIELLMLVEQ